MNPNPVTEPPSTNLLRALTELQDNPLQPTKVLDKKQEQPIGTLSPFIQQLWKQRQLHIQEHTAVRADMVAHLSEYGQLLEKVGTLSGDEETKFETAFQAILDRSTKIGIQYHLVDQTLRAFIHIDFAESIGEFVPVIREGFLIAIRRDDGRNDWTCPCAELRGMIRHFHQRHVELQKPYTREHPFFSGRKPVVHLAVQLAQSEGPPKVFGPQAKAYHAQANG